MSTRWRILRKQWTDDGVKYSIWADFYPNEHGVMVECDGLNKMPHGKPMRPDLRTDGNIFHPPDVFTYESFEVPDDTDNSGRPATNSKGNAGPT